MIPVISIIMPAYNRAHLLPRVIKTVLLQTYQNWELIIVDDGSSDGTDELIKASITDKRIKYIRKPNTGAAHSRNVGASHSVAEWVTFLDSDDEVEPKWLETVVSSIKPSTAIISINAKKVFNDGRVVTEGYQVYHIGGRTFTVKPTAGSLFVRKELFARIGGYDNTLMSNHHTDLAIRLLQKLSDDENVELINVPLVRINVHGEARIRSDQEKVYKGALQFIEKHKDFFLKNDKKSLANFYAIIADAKLKMRNKQEAFKNQLLSIYYNPLHPVRYLKFLKIIIA